MADKPRPCGRCGIPVQPKRPGTHPICRDCRVADKVYVRLVST